MEDKRNPLQDMIDEHSGQQFDVPMAHYISKFAEADPEVLAARTGIAFKQSDRQDSADADSTDADSIGSGTFEVELLGRPISITWPTLDMVYADTGDSPDTKTVIILADLLLNGQLIPSSGTWKSYAEIPWGDHYLKAFQGRCIMRLAYMFKDRESFDAACEKLGGARVSDNTDYFEFEFLDGVNVRLAFWEGDDEFGPTSQILFSDNAQFAFSAEDLAAVGDILLSALKRCK